MKLKDFNEFQHAKNTIRKVSEDSSKIEKMGTAQYLSEDERMVVDFKNGDFEPADIHKKVKDSLLIFSDITKQTLSCSRTCANFYLVVNDDRINRLNAQQRKSLALARRGDVDFAIWGLYRLRNYCFKKISVYSATQFDRWLGKIKII